jgi:hypothetical protein
MMKNTLMTGGAFAIALSAVLARAAGDVDPAGWKIVSATSEEMVRAQQPARQAIDGKPGSLWHTRWGEHATPHPHDLVIDLGAPLTLRGFSYLPRQDGAPNGVVTDFEVALSGDGVAWRVAAAGKFSPDAREGREQVASFAAPVEGRYLRFRSLGALGPRPVTVVAELGVFTGAVQAAARGGGAAHLAGVAGRGGPIGHRRRAARSRDLLRALHRAEGRTQALGPVLPAAGGRGDRRDAGDRAGRVLEARGDGADSPGRLDCDVPRRRVGCLTARALPRAACGWGALRGDDPM